MRSKAEQLRKEILNDLLTAMTVGGYVKVKVLLTALPFQNQSYNYN